MKRKCISILILMILIVTPIFSVGKISKAYSGDGTEESPYIIKTAQDLFDIPSGSDAFYKLANDINMENIKKEPLPVFKGVLDGDGFTIKNINIISDTSSLRVGLFSELKNAEIKNLTLDSGKITTTVGAAGGLAAYSDNSAITNCHVKNFVVNGNNEVGAIIGATANKTIVKNSSAKTSTITGNSYIGGLIGSIGSTVEVSDCTVRSTKVSGGGPVGAFAGYLYYGNLSNSNVINSTTEGTTNTGSLCGAVHNSTIINSFSIGGSVSSNGLNTGGLIGYTTASKISKCYTTTNVHSTKSVVGGLIGQIGANTTVSECFAENEIKGTTLVGGLVGNPYNETNGRVTEIQIINSYSTGNMTATDVNGIAGGVSATNASKIENSYAARKISADVKHGISPSGNVLNSYFDEKLARKSTPENQARQTNIMYRRINYSWDFNDIWMIDEENDYPRLRFAIGYDEPYPEDPEDPNVPVTAKFKMVLEVGEQLQLSLHNNLIINEDAVWTTSDSAIATVDKKGVVKAVKPGTVVITAEYEDEDYVEKISILVVEDATYLRLAVDMRVGEKALATIDDLSDTIKVTWSSMNRDIATVSKRGYVKAIRKGLTVINATGTKGENYGQVYVRIR